MPKKEKAHWEEIQNDVWQAHQENGGGMLSRTLHSNSFTRESFYLKAPRLNGRPMYHLDRMLISGRSFAEHKFASDVIAHNKTVFQALGDLGMDIEDVIGSEGYDTAMWWTFSPYIHALLSTMTGDVESLIDIFKWASDGESVQNSSSPNSWQGVHLKGLEVFNQFGGSGMFVLGKDPNSISHKLAKSEAERVVREVFSK